MLPVNSSCLDIKLTGKTCITAECFDLGGCSRVSCLLQTVRAVWVCPTHQRAPMTERRYACDVVSVDVHGKTPNSTTEVPLLNCWRCKKRNGRTPYHRKCADTADHEEGNIQNQGLFRATVASTVARAVAAQCCRHHSAVTPDVSLTC